jgi:hypothetical protein
MKPAIVVLMNCLNRCPAAGAIKWTDVMGKHAEGV